MRYITRVFSVVKESFYGPERYARVATGRATAGITYAFFAATLGALSFSSMFILGFISLSGVDISREAVNRIYPDGLEITIKDGVASTNMQEPILISTDEVMNAFNLPANLSRVDEFGQYQNILVIDTTRELSLNDVEAYQSWAVLGNNNFYTHDSEEGITAQPLRGTPGIQVITESVAQDVIDGIRPFIVWGIPVALIVIAVSFVFFFGIFLLALAAPATLVVKLIAKLQGFSISYSGAYAVSLLAMVATTLVGSIAGFFFVDVPFILELILFCALIIINFKARAVPPPPPATVEQSKTV
jgi:hypothetical protein